MRIFVAGATGAVGRHLVPRLVSGGHNVVGLTRTPAKTGLLRDLGAEPVVADALNQKAIHAAVVAARPDVIVHQLTDLKGASDLRQFDRAFANSNQLRTTGTDHLLAAARDCGVKRMVAQSFCGWPYARVGGYVKTEDDPLDDNPPQEHRGTLDAIRNLEHAVTTTPGITGVALRYGGFYGPDTGVFDPPMIEQIRKRRTPLIGGGTAWWSFLHIADAAEATAVAVERGDGIYNIVDDDPAPVHDWLPELATMLGAKPPFRVPAWLGRLAAGEHVVVMMTESRAGSNAKAKRELGWSPRHPSWRQGFAEIIQNEARTAA
ncbi:NAD(P)-dependent oxidoreductase [Mesorhizobium sp. M7D.F.Ca.US.005.01.1.1]|jgi:2-alkyl-3-oxoalkanoate reductase|uniref:Nucleoside-diphosphate-sugar epimerase n=1 Tax=Rhizobium loti TaxID=381 RepID=A0A8E3B108_RHILI|nr:MULTISPECIES: NAD(P)-dependent oxidoreductase [Mesorhizobium]AZO41362.1 NAD(P)-dependent oxidoreductase [Mesorhizobium sp. M7D.F.Ca.US.005.01.1.1]PWJ85545.1 nucleoside-diphosphate-sugar epimerase [Mesorhizobium loti]